MQGPCWDSCDPICVAFCATGRVQHIEVGKDPETWVSAGEYRGIGALKSRKPGGKA
jgi:hypothetical protein